MFSLSFEHNPRSHQIQLDRAAENVMVCNRDCVGGMEESQAELRGWETVDELRSDEMVPRESDSNLWPQFYFFLFLS